MVILFRYLQLSRVDNNICRSTKAQHSAFIVFLLLVILLVALITAQLVPSTYLGFLNGSRALIRLAAAAK